MDFFAASMLINMVIMGTMLYLRTRLPQRIHYGKQALRSRGCVWVLISACLVIAAMLVLGPGCLPAAMTIWMGVFASCLPAPLFIRTGRLLPKLLCLLFALELVVMGGFVCSGAWQFGAESDRALALEKVSRDATTSLTKQLRSIGRSDKNAYPKGELALSAVWTKYRATLQIPGYVDERGVIHGVSPVPVWHSRLSNLYQLRPVRRVLVYTGGTLEKGGIGAL